MIASNPSLLHAADRHAKTGLHLAAERNNVELARVLIDSGADIEAQSAWGASPLEWAATVGSADVAELLLAHGAGGLTLITSAALGKLDQVTRLLDSTSDLSIHGRRGAASLPSEEWPADTAHMLGDVLSDALYAAARNGHVEVAAYLLSRGASANAKGFFGATAIHWAAMNGWEETVELLLSHSAAVDILDPRFQSYPEGWAEEGGHSRLAERLRTLRLRSIAPDPGTGPL